ncbi:TrmB family transcriptional regulator [Halococcus hamelinensis]|uniref:TrmB family transcriptional regulator n=1 Tax=Halococcus hamelinensis TaxID=332168 RepID=UPI003182C5D1
MVSATEEEVIDLLQDLGLKEYEAKCFAALTRLSSGTAKEISDTAEVPRTRVYDAVRVLESSGLVEIQHGNHSTSERSGLTRRSSSSGIAIRPVSTNSTRRSTASRANNRVLNRSHTRSGRSRPPPRSQPVLRR